MKTTTKMMDNSDRPLKIVIVGAGVFHSYRGVFLGAH